MATNLALDDKLIADAQQLGCHKTKKAAVTAALEEYVRRRRLDALLAVMGTVEFDDDWDPIEHRREQRRLAAERAARLWPD